VLKGIKRVEFQLECSATHFRDEQEPHGSRRVAPIRSRPQEPYREVEMLEVMRIAIEQGQQL
jgi:hypothetical protein